MSTSAELLLERVRSATEDEYTIESELGRGGMAAVFLARDKALDRRVAIKVMLPDLIDVEGISDRFVIEARTAAHLDHPGIVTVYSVKQRAGLLFIVMKYIEGRTLESVMKGEYALDQSIVTTLVSQVAEALHFAHGEGVVHRDVKPSNIIIDTKGRPIVTDFGIAKIQSQKSITVTGSMLGTPAYMSPEQCRGLPATAHSDQYSLGVMTYEMLTRKLPFEGTIFELINAHCNEPPPPLTEAVPGIDPVLAEAVMRMLAKSPRDRWPALTDVAKALGNNAPHQRRTSEVRAVIAALVRGIEDTGPAPRRAPDGIDISAAATEVATTPAPQLVVTPPDPSIEVGATVQLKVSESSGASLGGFRITWKSEDPTIATVDETGIVTGKSVGFAKITASGGAAFGRVAVTVKAPRVDTLVVTPQSPELVAGHDIQFVATALDTRGTTLVGQQVHWQSSDVAVCAVSGNGRAIGLAPGKATITAVCGDVQGMAQVKVRLPGVERITIEPGDANIETEETRRLIATAFGPADRKLDGRAIVWRSTVPTVVTVAADGTIKGVAPGTAAVIAECEGKQGLASISVRSQPVVAVRIQPEQLKLEAGRSLQLKGVPEDRGGRTVNEKAIEWHSDDDQVALVDASGKVHAVREGRTHVRATIGDARSSIEVTVEPRKAAQVRIDAHPPALTVGDFMSLDATVLDGDGASLQGRAVAWKSDNPNVITVSSTGVCEAKKPGGVRITATCDQARATTKLNAAAGAAEAATAAMPIVGRLEPPKQETVPRVPPRKRSRAIPIGVAVLALAAIGVWAATRNRGAAPGANAPSEAAVATNTTPLPDTATKQIIPPAADPVTNPAAGTNPATTTKAPVVAGVPTRPVDSAGRPGATASGNTGAAPVTPVGSAARGTTNPATNTQTASGQTNPPGGSNTGRGVATRPDSPAVNPPVTNPVTTAAPPPVTAAAPPPVTAAAPPPVVSPPPAGRSAAEENHAALCANPSIPGSALTSALGNDPAARLRSLYVPRDAADTKAKDNMLNALKDITRLRATANTVRNEAAGDACDWLMKVDFNGVNPFGQPRSRSYQLRVRLEMINGTPHVKNVFSATGG